MKARLALIGALAVGGFFVLTPHAEANSTCAVGPGPVAAGQTADGGQACLATDYGSGTVTAGQNYLAADGSEGNTEPTDGYAAVDGSGPSACASGDYHPGGANNSLTDSLPGGPCAPQAAGYP